MLHESWTLSQWLHHLTFPAVVAIMVIVAVLVIGRHGVPSGKRKPPPPYKYMKPK